MKCPQCGGESRQQIAAHWWRCTSPVVVGQVANPEPLAPQVTDPVYGPCGHEYCEPTGPVDTSEACRCGTIPIGTCQECGVLVCGDHSQQTGAGRVCRSHVEQRAAERAAEESAKRRSKEARMAEAIREMKTVEHLKLANRASLSEADRKRLLGSAIRAAREQGQQPTLEIWDMSANGPFILKGLKKTKLWAVRFTNPRPAWHLRYGIGSSSCIFDVVVTERGGLIYRAIGSPRPQDFNRYWLARETATVSAPIGRKPKYSRNRGFSGCWRVRAAESLPTTVADEWTGETEPLPLRLDEFLGGGSSD